MAFENEDAGNGTPLSNDVGTLPTNAPAAPPIPQPAQPPTRPADAVQALPVSPAAPSRSFFGSLVHSLLGSALAETAKGGRAVVKGLAGPAPVDYSTDASGKTVATPRADNTKTRLERMAEAALLGLSAGAAMPPQKSKAAAWGAGIGVGAQAEMQRSQGNDLLKRKQSAEDYERGQKELTDKAVRAMHNASTYSLWQKAIDEQNDHDPERKKNMDVVNALQEYNDRNPKNGMSVQIVTPEAAMAMHEADNHSVAKHTYLPLGMTGAKDANGSPVFEQDGTTPKQTGQIAVISGDGKLPLPQSFVNDAKEYGKLAGISGADQLTANMEVPLATFLNIDKRINDVKLKEQDGWKNAHDVILSDGKTHAQMNTVTSKTRPYPEGVTPLAVKKDEADIEEKQAGAFEKRALGKKALAEANGTSEEIAGQAMDLVEGDLVPSQLSKRSKSFNTILKAARDYSISKYGKPFDFEKAQRDYQFAQNIGTQNTLKYLNSLTGNPKTGEKGNLQLLVDISNGVDRSDFPAINDLDAWGKLQTGDPKYIPLYNVAVDVSDQFAKIMAGGGSGNVTSDKKIEQGLKMFRTGFSKSEVQAAASSTLQMLSNRKREFIGTNRYLQKDYGSGGDNQSQVEPSGWTHKGLAADGKTTIYLMPDQSIQDAQGNKFDANGNPLKGTK